MIVKFDFLCVTSELFQIIGKFVDLVMFIAVLDSIFWMYISQQNRFRLLCFKILYLHSNI